MALEVFDPALRAREKAASREEDARAIAEGKKSPEQVSRDNASFAFVGAVVRFPPSHR